MFLRTPWCRLAFLSLVIALPGPARAAPREPRILILNSYHAGYRGTDDLVAGFVEQIRRRTPDADLRVESLDALENRGPEHDTWVREMLRRKYANRRFDLIYTTDDYAFDVVESARDGLFAATPLVFAGTNAFDASRIAGRLQTAGVDERPSFEDTLNLMQRLHPGLRTLLVIVDDSSTGQRNAAEMRRALAGRPDLEVRWVAGADIDRIEGELGRLRSDGAAFYMASSVPARDGTRLSSGAALRWLASSADVPIYGGWEFSLGDGIVGGRLVSLRQHGRVAADLGLDLLDGQTIADRLRPSPNVYLFDRRALDRFGIDAARLPAGSVIVHEPPAWWTRFVTPVLAVLSLGLLALAVVSTRRAVRSHRVAERERRKFATIFRTLPDIAVLTDRATGRFLDVNEAYERAHGWLAEQVIGRTSSELETWGSAQAREELLRAIGAHGSVQNHRSLFRRRNGECFPVLISSSVVRLEGRDCLALTARDISDVDARERQAAEARSFADQLLAALPIVLCVFDASRRPVRWNRVFEEVTGLSAAEIAACDAFDFIDPADRSRAIAVFEHMRDGRIRSVEARLQPKSGPSVPYQFSGTRVELGGRMHFIGAAVDIAQRVHAQEALQRERGQLEVTVAERTADLRIAKEAAEAANRAKSVFLSNMSHELRTPLNGILGMIHLALRNPSDARQEDQLRKADGAANHLLETISDVLDLARIEAGGLRLASQRFTIGELLRGLQSSLDGVAHRAGLGLRLECAPALRDRPWIGDRVRIGQVLLNLAGNALKFTRQGEVAVRASLRAAEDGRACLAFEVEDTGVGIAAADQARIFLPFEQVDGSSTRGFGGTGLGLALSRRLAESMGGTIGVRSAPGRGSTFTFTAMVEAAAADGATPGLTDLMALGAALRARHAGTRVLVVEDELLSREFLGALLRDAGLEVDEAHDGRQAIERFAAHPPRLVLMDLRLPVIDGLAATHALRARDDGRTVPIVALTANALKEDREACLAAGMNAFLAKPAPPREVLDVVLRLLDAAASAAAPP
jgi:PAS domain S-box-containing protein